MPSSEPWQRGFFEFYTLSWFHFYVAACVAVFSILLVMIERNTRSIVIVLLGAAAAVLPIIDTLAFAGEFVSGRLDMIRNIAEVRSPYAVPDIHAFHLMAAVVYRAHAAAECLVDIPAQGSGAAVRRHRRARWDSR